MTKPSTPVHSHKPKVPTKMYRVLQEGAIFNMKPHAHGDTVELTDEEFANHQERGVCLAPVKEGDE